MTEFKKLLFTQAHNKTLFDSSVSVSHEGTTLHLRIDNKDTITAAAYEGPADAWMSSLCELLLNMPLAEARFVGMPHWEMVWREDQFFWDMKLEREDRLFFLPVELLHAALDIYRGREFLYKEESPLICRCMGVREKDVVASLNSATDPSLEVLLKDTKAGMGCRTCVPQLKKLLKFSSENKTVAEKESRTICRCFSVSDKSIVSYRDSTKNPTLEGLATETKAGTGCRSCVPQLKQILFVKPETKSRQYKSRPIADWIEAIDNALSRFPESSSWKLNVESMKGNVVMISYDLKVTQREEELMAKKLQGFLAGATDADLAFFLTRSLQR